MEKRSRKGGREDGERKNQVVVSARETLQEPAARKDCPEGASGVVLLETARSEGLFCFGTFEIRPRGSGE